MIQNYTVIWDTSKTLLISEFLYWLQVFGYLTIWSCLKKTPQDLKCVVLKHRCPKVPLLCPRVLSVALVSSPLLPDQFRLSHLRKCNWCKIAPQQMWLTFPHLSSSSWLTTLDEGRNGLVWGEKGQDLGHQWSPIPWYQFSRRCWMWAALSCCISIPGSGVQHHLYADFWCSDGPVFGVSEVLSWQQMEHKASSTPSRSQKQE